MRTSFGLVVGLILGLLLVAPNGAWAQGQNVVTLPASRVATDASGTIAVTSTFQQVWAAQSARVGCLIQNNGTHNMYVYSGTTASAVTTSSLVLAPGAVYNCQSGGLVNNSAIQITGTATEVFTATLDGAGTISAPTTVSTGGGSAAVTIADGADVTQGALADAASAAGGVGSVSAKLRLMTTQLGTINTTLGTPIQATGGTVGLVAGSAIIGKVGIDQTTPGTTNGVQVVATTTVSTVSTSITRPGDTNAYAANDAFANSTSVPTAGGFTLTSACRASGGNGTVLSAALSMSAGSAFQGEIWIFDQAVTATNDNSALSVSDSDVLNLVGVIPFNTTDVNAANAISYVNGLNLGYTCVGTANLRFLVKVIAAFTPANAEVLSVRVQVAN